MSAGFLTESEVLDICSKSFLHDFVFKDLIFYNKDKKTKELADLIIMLGDDILCFQVKRREGFSPDSLNDDTELERLEKRIDKASEQLSRTFSRIKSGKHSANNIRGIEHSFNISSKANLYGIIILHVAGNSLI